MRKSVILALTCAALTATTLADATPRERLRDRIAA